MDADRCRNAQAGPHNATLTVETKRKGAAAKAGHDLVIEVTSWEAELDVAKDPAVTLRADGGSLRVREGSGGVTTLGDEEKAGIEQTIDDEVLKGAARSSSARAPSSWTPAAHMQPSMGSSSWRARAARSRSS